MADVDPLAAQRPEGDPGPEVRADLADVAGPEPEPGARHERGGGDAPALEVELEEGRLGVGLGVAVDHADQVEGVNAEADDVPVAGHPAILPSERAREHARRVTAPSSGAGAEA